MLKITLFDNLTLTYDGKPFTFKGIPKTVPLLAYLLLHQDRPIHRDELAFALWPDESEKSARGKLRRHIYALRQLLPNPDYISRNGTQIAWQSAETDWLDVTAFEQASQTPDQLPQVVVLYGRGLLPQVDEAWLTPIRNRYQQIFTAALAHLIDRHTRQQAWADAIALAECWLAVEPLNEAAARALITVRYRSGDQSGALQSYFDFEERLADELDVSPSDALFDLYHRVANRLALEDADPPPHNIPAALTRFFGRTLDLINITQLLTTNRLITLTGFGGSGKTRLALEVARQLLPTFRDGTYFVDLAPLRDSADILPTLSTTLSLREATTLHTFLHDKQMLLILDNFEQLLDGATIVTDLLHAAPNLKIIVTSRSVLQLYGEQEYPVPPLPVPQDVPKQLDQLLEYAAVALFVARARAHRPTFTLAAHNAADIVQLCQQLDGLPLAIELAAARIKLFTPAALCRHLAQRLTILTSRQLPARQRTLYATIDWSYQLLTPEQQTLFAQLSVFQDGFTVPAVGVVIYQRTPQFDLDLLEQLTALTEQSMLVVDNSDSEPRFSMLPLLRDFALQQLDATQLPPLQSRCLAYFAWFSAERARDWEVNDDQPLWLARLQNERENFRAALRWGTRHAATTEDVNHAASLMQYLSNSYWRVSGLLREGQKWAERLLHFRSQLSVDNSIHCLGSLSGALLFQGDHESAENHLLEMLALAEQVNDQHHISFALVYLGLNAGRQGQYDLAQARLERAITIEQTHHPDTMTYYRMNALNNLAIVYKYQGKIDEAIEIHQQLLAHRRQQGETTQIAGTLSNLADLAILRDDFAAAEDALREALAIRQRVDDKLGLLNTIGKIIKLAFVRDPSLQVVTLHSALGQLHEQFDYPMTPAVQAGFDKRVAALRGMFSAETFQQAWSDGQPISLYDTIQLLPI